MGGEGIPTIDVGGAAFPATRRVVSGSDADECPLLFAKGSSHLSYFFLGVCSSVLYLDAEATNDAVMFDENGGRSSDINQRTAMALAIHYHKPARRGDFRWATSTFIEKNLPDGTKIEDLPEDLQTCLSRFNSLYQNVRIGDRYLLQYVPGSGISLALNERLLGTVGAELPPKRQAELARLVYSVWFGSKAPFAESMKRELLSPIDPPIKVHVNVPAIDEASIVASCGGDVWSNILATAGVGEDRESPSMISEDERKELDSLGLLQLVEDSDSSQSVVNPSSNDGQRTQSALARVRHLLFPSNPTVPPMRRATSSGSVSKSATLTTAVEDAASEKESPYNLLLGLGGAAFLLPHLAMLLSLPPVLQRRGAPYLPTFGNKLQTMFGLIRSHVLRSRHLQQKMTDQSLRFVDLGSGDGRVVFRAAREGLFAKSVGYEINPALHGFVSIRRLLTPGYWANTAFYCRDLWKIQLQGYDVVAVYGLAPIMKRLGKKLEEELKPGSIVVSNVFPVPGWRVCTNTNESIKKTSGSQSGEGVFLYEVPECFGGKDDSNE
ncbi:hypothetical protein ACHAXT_008925 [Thalassiosira profunda]